MLKKFGKAGVRGFWRAEFGGATVDGVFLMASAVALTLGVSATIGAGTEVQSDKMEACLDMDAKTKAGGLGADPTMTRIVGNCE